MVNKGEYLEYGSYPNCDFSNFKKIGKFKVEEKIGEGGQGAAFIVTLNGEKKVLKYISDNLLDSMKVILTGVQQNIDRGSPHKAFAWPEFIARKDGNPVGYIMPLSKQKYTLDKYANSRALIAGDKANDPNAQREKEKVDHCPMQVRIKAALNLCEAMMALHSTQAGLCYQDLNPKNIMMDFETGDISIIDLDNVTGSGHNNTGVLGQGDYMSPEAIRIKELPGYHTRLPDKYSDYHSLAVVIYFLLMRDHPIMCGQLPYNCDPFAAIPLEPLGKDALFCFDPTDSSNAPTKNANSPIHWKRYPAYLQDAFRKTFSKKALLSAYSDLNAADPDTGRLPLSTRQSNRLSEAAWIKILTRLSAELVECENGKCAINAGGKEFRHEYFYDPKRKAFRCDDCKTWNANFHFVLKSPLMDIEEIPLLPGNEIRRCQLTNAVNFAQGRKPLDRIFSIRLLQGTLCIGNRVDEEVTILPDKGKPASLKTGQATPLQNNLKITLPASVGGGEVLIRKIN